MYPNTFTRPSLLASLRNIGWGNILDGTQKTLGVINQAIPIVYQVKPVLSNMRSALKIANIINSPDTNSSNNTNTNNINTPNTTKSYSTKPVFYI